MTDVLFALEVALELMFLHVVERYHAHVDPRPVALQSRPGLLDHLPHLKCVRKTLSSGEIQQPQNKTKQQ